MLALPSARGRGEDAVATNTDYRNRPGALVRGAQSGIEKDLCTSPHLSLRLIARSGGGGGGGGSTPNGSPRLPSAIKCAFATDRGASWTGSSHRSADQSRVRVSTAAKAIRFHRLPQHAPDSTRRTPLVFGVAVTPRPPRFYQTARATKKRCRVGVTALNPRTLSRSICLGSTTRFCQILPSAEKHLDFPSFRCRCVRGESTGGTRQADRLRTQRAYPTALSDDFIIASITPPTTNSHTTSDVSNWGRGGFRPGIVLRQNCGRFYYYKLDGICGAVAGPRAPTGACTRPLSSLAMRRLLWMKLVWSVRRRALDAAY